MIIKHKVMLKLLRVCRHKAKTAWFSLGDRTQVSEVIQGLTDISVASPILWIHTCEHNMQHSADTTTLSVWTIIHQIPFDLRTVQS